MTVEVVINRNRNGILIARIRHHGQFGSNLLAGRQLTNVDTAKQKIKERLWRELRPVEVEIHWTVQA